MASWLGQYCINVADLDRSVKFYESLGLSCTSRTEIPQAWEAIIEHPATGSKLQLAQQKDEPFRAGNALWKLYINTRDVAGTFTTALENGATEDSKPERLDRWPVTVAFVRDPDGHLVEFVERDPWAETDPQDAPWLGQYCVNVSDIDASIAFWETLGLTCTSKTEIPQAFEAILESPGRGGKIQLAQQKDGGPIDMGAVWKLYVHTDDAAGLHAEVVAAGAESVMEPVRLERWPTTVSYLKGPDGYLVELMQRHDS